MSPSRKARLRQRMLRFWVMLALLFAVGIGLLEALVRFAFPEINHQGTELALFREHAFGDTMGWRPNATGDVFGTPVVIDEFGFRKLPSPVDSRESWLILGDSVTFGVGVDATNTFVGRLQDHYRDVKLWNTAVVGYSALDYLAVQQHFEDPQKKLHRILLFLCLNDIHPYPNLQPIPQGGVARALGWLGRNSKLYLLLKNLFFDRSRQYFADDLARYYEDRPSFTQLRQTLSTLQQSAKTANLPLTVVLIPYEYQVRTKSEALARPQKLLQNFFATNQVPCLDALPWFTASGIDSKKLFLYGDAMHLSREGHQLIYEHLVKELDK